MKKKVKVHMLPTGDITGIVLHSTWLDKIVHTKESELNAVLNIGGTSQHLYLTSDEKIEEGDWFIDSVITSNISVKKSRNLNDGSYYNSEFCRKIVATTDKALVYNQIDVKEVQGIKMEASYHKELPQIPQSFIKQYVESGGSIDEVEIEYTDWCDYDDDNTWGGLDKADLRIKVDSNNCVIIHTVKDNWSREEVETLVAKAFKVGYDKSYTGFPYIEEHLGPAIKSWIKENMK